MRRIIIVFLLFAFTSAFGQESEIKAILTNAKRDSTDKTCQKLFNDFYDAFESDEGQASPLMTNATLNLLQDEQNPNFPNKLLVDLLLQYINSVSQPDKALIWIQALKDEYQNVYHRPSPLILLYQGESLINDHRNAEAHDHFLTFYKKYPNSVMALVYIYTTETDSNLKLTWLSILKKLYPNHWVVKTLN